MSASDLADMHDRLRRDTIKMLAFGEPLSAQQSLKVDLACSLRWQIDKFVSTQLSGGDIDLKQLTSATEALRSLFPTSGGISDLDIERQNASAREVLFNLIERARMADEVEAAEAMQREEQMAVAAAMLTTPPITAPSDPDAPPSANVRHDYIDHATIEPNGSPPVPTPITPVEANKQSSYAAFARWSAQQADDFRKFDMPPGF